MGKRRSNDDGTVMMQFCPKGRGSDSERMPGVLPVKIPGLGKIEVSIPVRAPGDCAEVPRELYEALRAVGAPVAITRRKRQKYTHRVPEDALGFRGEREEEHIGRKG